MKNLKRNIELINKGLPLDLPLRRLKELALTKIGKVEYISKKIKVSSRHKIRQPEVKRCSYCGKEYLGFNKYCSRYCRRKISNQKQYRYYADKMKSDWQFALKMRMRWNLKDAIRFYTKTGKIRKSHQYLDYPAIIKHLGPCPGKRNEWHIDHIKPLSSFDISKGISEIKKAFAPNNLRWLPAKENLMKGKSNP